MVSLQTWNFKTSSTKTGLFLQTTGKSASPGLQKCPIYVQRLSTESLLHYTNSLSMEKVNSYPSVTLPDLCFGLIKSSLIYIDFYYNVSNIGKSDNNWDTTSLYGGPY